MRCSLDRASSGDESGRGQSTAAQWDQRAKMVIFGATQREWGKVKCVESRPQRWTSSRKPVPRMEPGKKAAPLTFRECFHFCARALWNTFLRKQVHSNMDTVCSKTIKLRQSLQKWLWIWTHYRDSTLRLGFFISDSVNQCTMAGWQQEPTSLWNNGTDVSSMTQSHIFPSPWRVAGAISVKGPTVGPSLSLLSLTFPHAGPRTPPVFLSKTQSCQLPINPSISE